MALDSGALGPPFEFEEQPTAIDEDVSPLDTDVVIAGGGVGGMSAAIEAARAGARVVLIEARPELGGNAARSTGYIAFAGTSMQRAEGLDDSPDCLVRDLEDEVRKRRADFGIVFDRRLAARFAADSAAAFDFLRDLGVRFGRWVPRPSQHSAERLVAIAENTDFRTRFESVLQELGISVLLEHRVVSLRLEAGRVSGVVAVSTGATPARRHVTASAGVILATGGFQANHQLRTRFEPEHLAQTAYPGLDTCRGDGHLLAQAIGADLINMTMIPQYVRFPSALLEDAIALNVAGYRFHDETGPYFDRVEALRNQERGAAFYLFDARAAREREDLLAGLPAPIRTEESVAEVAAAIGAAPAVVERTVRDWNALVVSGAERDPEFGRAVFPSTRCAITEPPFHFTPAVVGATFTAGGLSVDPDLRALDIFGRPIPGLFAAGDCLGGVNPAAGVGGLHISSAVTLGRAVGAVVARATDPSAGAL
jgi:succinate dehydrogenase/fumarate reductase flavoprotein subunit